RSAGSLLCGAACVAFLLPVSLSAQLATTPVPATAAPQAGSTPQIITVQTPAPATNQISTGPDWSRAGSQSNGAVAVARTDEDRARGSYRTPDAPTEFQRLVSRTLGGNLPIFGADLFNNSPSTFAPVGDAQVTPEYVIGTGDEIRVSATGQLNQQGTFVVSRGGTISIPEVGTLTVAGLRFRELQPFLRQQIGRVYRNFELNVTLGQLRSIQVYILGETRQPGAYTVSSLSTLVNALFVSGGVRPQGSLRRIELHRANNTVTVVDLYDLLLRGDKSKDVALQAGDIIFVPAAGPQVAVAGSVTNPAIYELRGESTLNQLLQLANGTTSSANELTVRVESISNAQRTVDNVSLQTSGNLALHAGDIVTVGAISDQFANAVTLRGNVANPGRYMWHPGMRLSDLIPNAATLITRNYYRSRNALGQAATGEVPTAQLQPGQGRLAVSTSPSSGTAGTNGSAGTTAEAPTPTSASVANNTGGGTTVGDALTQNNGTFAATNDVILSAPDVDLAYAVIERLDPTTLTTSLIPFNLAAVLGGSDATQNLPLAAGDVVTVFSKSDIRVPQSQQTRYVRLEGEFVASGVYSVRPGETLRQLIVRAGGFTPDAYLFASEFTRQSTRRVEQQRLREYADSLESQIDSDTNRQISSALDINVTAQTAPVTASSARAAVARLRNVQPTGRIVLKLLPTSVGIESVPDLPLEDGDRFIVPRQPSTVNVAGEVYNSSAFLFEPNLQVRNYLRNAGGPSRNADANRVFVIRADGSVVSRQYANVVKAPSLPGDTVVVPPQFNRRNLLRDIVAISNIFGQVATPLALLAVLR
ncbi:MAG: SLBB domain-containing protein, partial [Janthinobacterium lividum]